MNAITATITGVSLIVAERNDAGLVCQTLVNEVRPASFASADTALAFASLGRTSAWELDANGGVEATVAPVDNRFNGTVAARLWEAVGTTHEPFAVAFADSVLDGDLIGDMDLEGMAVVAGSRLEGDSMRIHMVSEGKTWADRYTTDFPRHQLVQVARRKA
jgi:hypothetical protein